MSTALSLSQMGWKPFFQQQLFTFQGSASLTIARVSAMYRGHIEVMTETHSQLPLPVLADLSDLAVGDWIAIDDDGRIVEVFERSSLFSRKAAGSKLGLQLIAANIDTAFIVCGLDHNFNLSRIERYLALVKEAEVEPVVVLTKADGCDHVFDYIDKVRALDAMLMIEAVNGLEIDSLKPLLSWCGSGQTVAFIGSSGVGKSTLINTLMGQQQQQTGAARVDDSRGRHTTTTRSLHLLQSGGLLLDTPGMRELQLSDCEKGVEGTFADIVELARDCQFNDCHHQSEPGCQVQMALHSGQLSQRRLDNYVKLLKEQAFNRASLAERRDKDRQLHKHYRKAINAAQRSKNRR